MIDYRRMEAANAAMRQAVLLMSKTAPGLLPVYMSANCIPTEDTSVTVRTGVDGGMPVLEYNVDFVTRLEPSLLGAVVYMQCLKIALHHCDKRKQEPLSMLKLASDIVVAEYARKVVDTSIGNNLEIVNRIFPSYWNHWPVLKKHGFHPETDLTLEKLFEILKEEYASQEPEESDDDSQEDSSQGTSRETRKETSDSPGKSGKKTEQKQEESGGSQGESGEHGDDSEETGDEPGGEGKSREEKGKEGDEGDSGEGESGGDGDGEGSPDEGGESQDESDENSGSESSDDGGEGSPGEGADGSSGEGQDGGSVPDGSPGDSGDGDSEGGSDSEDGGDSAGGTEEGEGGEPVDDGSSGEGRGDSPKDDMERMSQYFSLSNAAGDLARWDNDSVASDNTTAKVLDALDKGMFDRMRGPLPLMLRNANRVKVDREAMFRRFMTSVQDEEFNPSWSRRNRKYLRYGMIAPGNLYEETQRILFCIDVSGSMYQGDAILNCLTVMENIVNGLSVDIVYWDAVCSPVFDTPRSIRDMAIYGGGRTDPDCVLRKLGPERYKYDGLIYLTDCIFNWPEPPRPRQIMILRSHGDYAFPDWCVFKEDLDTFIGK